MLLAIVVVLGVVSTTWPLSSSLVPTDTKSVAETLFGAFVLPFEVVSVLLLAAVIGGVFLAKREHGGID